jgi:hypothetical protein
MLNTATSVAFSSSSSVTDIFSTFGNSSLTYEEPTMDSKGKGRATGSDELPPAETAAANPPENSTATASGKTMPPSPPAVCIITIGMAGERERNSESRAGNPG